MEQHFFRILRQWAWLILFAALLAAATAFFLIEQRPLVYRASSRLIVGPGVEGLSPDLNDLRAGGQLMQTYAELANTRPVLETVIQEASLAEDADTLARRITVRVDAETQILSIVVESSDAEEAAVVANAVADVLLRLSPSGGESPAAILSAQMRQQADDLQESILRGESRLEELRLELDEATTAVEQQTFMEQMAQERARLSDARATLALLYNTLKDTPTNQVRIIEPAVMGEQLPRRLPLVSLTGAFAGAVLALIAVLVYEYLDDTVKSPDDLRRVSQLALLSTASGHPGWERDVRDAALMVRSRPQSTTAEAYRMLGTKLPISGNGTGSPIRMLAVSSIMANEDAGEIAANLAIVLSQTGIRVVLVDANLHHPTIGQAFGISSYFGLTDVLTSHRNFSELFSVSWAPGLAVLPSGLPSFDAFAQLASPRMIDILDTLKAQADLVIVVTSPLLTFADSLYLTSRVDSVIISVRAGQVRQGALADVLASTESVGARILGTVFFRRSLSLADRFALLWRGLKLPSGGRKKLRLPTGRLEQRAPFVQSPADSAGVETASQEEGAAST